jgi:hypothetical protein
MFGSIICHMETTSLWLLLFGIDSTCHVMAMTNRNHRKRVEEEKHLLLPLMIASPPIQYWPQSDDNMAGNPG